jgi:hypothetical protein
MAGDSQDPRFGYWKISRHGKIEMSFGSAKKLFVEVKVMFSYVAVLKDLR